MTRESQKEKELVFGQRLGVLLGENWNVAQSPNERVWPDLVVNCEGKIFGLEVREVFSDIESSSGSSAKRDEYINNQKLHQIALKYYEQSVTPIRVQFLGKVIDESGIISTLVRTAKTLSDWQTEILEPDEDSKIFITRLPAGQKNYDKWVFVNDHGGWVKSISITDLQPAISEKEQNITRYNAHLDETRLLLVANPAFNSGRIDFYDEKASITSGFEKIYLLIYPNSVHIIK